LVPLVPLEVEALEVEGDLAGNLFFLAPSLLSPRIASRPKRSATPLTAFPIVPKIVSTMPLMSDLTVCFKVWMTPKIELSSPFPPDRQKTSVGGPDRVRDEGIVRSERVA